MRISAATAARLALLAAPLVAGGEEFQSGDFICRTLGTPVDAIEIAGYVGRDGAVTIPGRIEGFPVTLIGAEAFANQWRLTNVVLPDGVTIIGDRAFSWCTDLRDVALPETLIEVGAGAFECTRLMDVVFPGNVTDIGDGAFQSCNTLNRVSVPASVLHLGDRAFRNCYGLSAITVAEENPVYRSVDGVLFDESGSTLLVFPINRLGDYQIPVGTTHIAPSAFEACWRPTSILIPDTVVDIGDSAFASCTGLIHLAIPESVSRIGDGAFCCCASLTAISLPRGLQQIGFKTLASCWGLSSVDLPAGVAHLGSEALFDCRGLTNLVLPEGLRSIGDFALGNCRGLSSLAIPAGVTSLGTGVVNGCSGLQAIIVEDRNPAYRSVDGVLFDRALSTLMAYPPGRHGGYTIPAGVRCVGAQAFAGTALTDLEVPASVVTLGEHAFSVCRQLNAIRFRGDAPALPGGANDAFARVFATTYFLPGTAGWDEWILPTAPWVLPHPVILTAGFRPGLGTHGFGFTVSWATNASVVVEVSTTLEDPDWSPAATSALVDGWSPFVDPGWTNSPSRFYRVRVPSAW